MSDLNDSLAKALMRALLELNPKDMLSVDPSTNPFDPINNPFTKYTKGGTYTKSGSPSTYTKGGSYEKKDVYEKDDKRIAELISIWNNDPRIPDDLKENLLDSLRDQLKVNKSNSANN
ncbi:hypothetical protein [Winogradskyella tangerina]|uniref:hypothetical protein n=1 Tax=Winogradskyella tangerina TaxID=2023240 RepID=UPI000DBE5CFA|nr:hypothetical protein [Winogradskyella tangerina]